MAAVTAGTSVAGTRPRSFCPSSGSASLGDAIAGTLPFGNLRRLGIAISLATHPRLFLLDEPAAGLNDTETEELVVMIRQLAGMQIGVCVIDHDMNMITRPLRAPHRARLRHQDRGRPARGGAQ